MELVPKKHFLFFLNYYDFSNLFTVLLNLFSFFLIFFVKNYVEILFWVLF